MKTIVITGATDGIGLAAARELHRLGHSLILHGRSAEKLAKVQEELGDAAGFLADLSDLRVVSDLAARVAQAHPQIDVLINNAGVLKAPQTKTVDGYDIRFAVNTFAPAVLAKALARQMPSDGRVVHLSSAAQATVNLQAMRGFQPMADMDAYAQSKLAITLWSQEAGRVGPQVHVAVNPGSLLATNMVRDGFGLAGNDISIGSGILVRAALAPEFADRTGQYYDNDSKRFAVPHADAQNKRIRQGVVATIEELVKAAVSF